ncbi:MAG: MFS transporter, partial [Gammaproteobacteria bacterium]|nr:MFS transporter [Gammaproteobacteria bacterium]
MSCDFHCVNRYHDKPAIHPSGANAVFYSSFELLGFAPEFAQTLSVVAKSIVVGFAVLSPYMASKIGRRSFFLFIGVSSALCCSLLASYPFWPMIAGLEFVFVLLTTILLVSGCFALLLYYVLILELFPFQHRV